MAIEYSKNGQYDPRYSSVDGFNDSQLQDIAKMVWEKSGDAQNQLKMYGTSDINAFSGNMAGFVDRYVKPYLTFGKISIPDGDQAYLSKITSSMSQVVQDYKNNLRSAAPQYGEAQVKGADYFTPPPGASNPNGGTLSNQPQTIQPLQQSPTSMPAAAPAPIPFKDGLTAAQQDSIKNLVAGRQPQSWNSTDIANWNFATNNAPIPGAQQATIPTAKSAAYSVAQGDTLSSIARKNGTTVEALMAANPSITNPNLIRAGQNINIPGGQLPANQVSKGMTDLRAQVDATNGGLSANKDFVNGAFQAYLGRPASLQELSTFAGKTVQEVRDQLASGAIKPTLTPDKSSSVNIALLTDNKNLDLMMKSGNAGDSSGVNSFLSGTTAIQGQALDQVGQLEQQHADIVKTIMSSMDKLGTKGQELLKLEESMGITQDMNRLKEINAQIAAKMNEVTAQTQAIQGTRASSLIQSGEVAKMQREKAIEIGMLQTQQQALLGNIELAKSTAQRTLELEFAPVQAALDKAQLFLQINSQDLSRADQKKAAATAQALKVQQDAIDEAKQERQQNVELMLQMASSGIDTSKIDLKGSYADNAKIAAPLIARAAKIKAAGSGGGSGGGVVSPVSVAQEAAPSIPTFEEYLKSQEEAAGQSFDPIRRAALRTKYDQLAQAAQVKIASTNVTSPGSGNGLKLSQFDPAVQNLINSYNNGFIKDFSASDLKKYGPQINQAKQAGLLKTNTENDKPLTGVDAKLFAFSQTGISELGKIESAFKKIQSMPDSQKRAEMAKILAGQNTVIKSSIENAADAFGRIRSGGAVNSDESARFKSMILNSWNLVNGDLTSSLNQIPVLRSEFQSTIDSMGASGRQSVSTPSSGVPDIASLMAKYNF